MQKCVRIDQSPDADAWSGMGHKTNISQGKSFSKVPAGRAYASFQEGRIEKIQRERERDREPESDT